MKTLLNILHAESFSDVASAVRDLFTLKTLNNDLFGYAYYKDTYRQTENRVDSVVLRRLGFEAGVCGSHPFDPTKMKRLRDNACTQSSVRNEVLQELHTIDTLLGIHHFTDTAQRDSLRETLLNTRKKQVEKDIRATTAMWSLNTDDISERAELFLKCSVKHVFDVQAAHSRTSIAA